MDKEDKTYKKKYGFKKNIDYGKKIQRGLNKEIIRKISEIKKEPSWMLEKRIAAYDIFKKMGLTAWGPDLTGLDLNGIYYYVSADNTKARKWEDVPKEIKDTFDRLQIPEYEKKFFAGVESQFDSEVIYSNIRKELESQGVIFTDTDTAVQKYPEIIKKYFGTVIPANDNKFAALNTAAWSGGTFLFVPKNVKLAIPLQAYFRINAQNMGQFERTLIIADEGAEVTYIEGCSAPVYSTYSLHSGVVEIIANKNSHVRYITIQNWSKNIYNLVTQRAIAKENAHVEWIDCNIGSKVNMKYPAIYLSGKNSVGEIVSVAVAKNGQVFDTGGKIFHLAPHTTSKVISKSVSIGNGSSTFRGNLLVSENATDSTSFQKCDSLLISKESSANTFPYIKINNSESNVNHEASTGRINEEDIFYLMSRGFSEDDAITLILLGFIDPLVKELPLEYSIELRRLLKIDSKKMIA
ncbi:MAG: Fe-S cluster assembly protein SufB [Candidatus Marsarchaeota archaeon]|nr:Fe-S cluster assembly protein SufB [Candidatus Marsarchaeota archaeon]MCL5089737.1 Fe-S cluster assembly protein SufB [Candidatus Marsarchaeota archaeon]